MLSASEKPVSFGGAYLFEGTEGRCRFSPLTQRSSYSKLPFPQLCISSRLPLTLCINSANAVVKFQQPSADRAVVNRIINPKIAVLRVD